MEKNENDKIIDKYLCSICCCLLIEPVSLTKCFHIFCKKCLEQYIRSRNAQNLTCPLCRMTFKKQDYVSAYNLKSEIQRTKIKCKCGQNIPITEYERHSNNCNPNNKNDNSTVKYNCTLCSERDFNKDSYVKHIEDKHSNAHGVCAICSNLPWGDKNYKTYLLGHVDLRHKNKKDGRVGMTNDEYDDIIRKVLIKSVTER